MNVPPVGTIFLFDNEHHSLVLKVIRSIEVSLDKCHENVEVVEVRRSMLKNIRTGECRLLDFGQHNFTYPKGYTLTVISYPGEEEVII